MTWCKWCDMVASKQEVADFIAEGFRLDRGTFAAVEEAYAPTSDPGRIDIELADGTRISLRVESVR